MKVILASKSPRRSQLLTWAEIDFEVQAAETDESYPANLAPKEIAMHIAFNKAMKVREDTFRREPNGNEYPILAADTIVVLGDRIIGKPADYDHAIQTLTSLSGKSHSVITGVCILSRQEQIIFAEETFVKFYELSQKDIEHYVRRYQPFDKAGAYAIQEWIGVTGIESITGDFYNVMGLPVSRVVKELAALG